MFLKYDFERNPFKISLLFLYSIQDLTPPPPFVAPFSKLFYE